jgi:hypothetical protein
MLEKSFNNLSTFSGQFSTIFEHFWAHFQQFINNTNAITGGFCVVCGRERF